MALRAITISFIVSMLLLGLVVAPASACFGPKLFVAAGQDAQQEVLYALVTLYVQEKTGVESTRVIIEEGMEPLSLIDADKADLVLAPVDSGGDSVVFRVDGIPVLVTGERPVEDIQFTTVLPALKKLERKLTSDDVAQLVERVEGGESPMATVRNFFMERRLI